MIERKELIDFVVEHGVAETELCPDSEGLLCICCNNVWYSGEADGHKPDCLYMRAVKEKEIEVMKPENCKHNALWGHWEHGMCMHDSNAFSECTTRQNCGIFEKKEPE